MNKYRCGDLVIGNDLATKYSVTKPLSKWTVVGYLETPLEEGGLILASSDPRILEVIRSKFTDTRYESEMIPQKRLHSMIKKPYLSMDAICWTVDERCFTIYEPFHQDFNNEQLLRYLNSTDELGKEIL